jgi:hypothetical protein
VWKGEDGCWHEQVWRYGAVAADLAGDSPQEVIDAANARYGTE